jgi:hypothetical protein
MKRRLLLNSTKLIVAVGGLGLTFALSAHADCGVPVSRLSAHARVSNANLTERAGIAEALPVPDSNAVGQSDADSDQRGSIVGLWLSTFVSGVQIVDQGFDQWNSDGNEVLNDDTAPATGNVCLGVFVRSGPSTYKLKHPSWTIDSAGNVTGTAIIREQVTVAPDGKSYSGTFQVNLFDLSNNPMGQIAGTITAHRITVDF